MIDDWMNQMEQVQNLLPETTPPDPFEYQLEGINLLYERQRCILADDTGLGKTVQAILTCRAWGVTRVLVVVPSKLKNNFAGELERWYPEAPYTILAGSERENVQTIQDYEWGFLIAAYENIQANNAAREKKRLDTWWKNVTRLKRENPGVPLPEPPPPPIDWAKLLLKKQFEVVIFDEAHRLRNRKAYWTVGAFQLADRAGGVIPMTATAVQNRIEDLWPLLRIVNRERYGSYWDFAKRHAKARPGPFGWIVESEPTNVDSLTREIAPYFIRRTKDQVATQLPPVTEKDIWVDMDGEQERIYREMESEMLAKLGPEEWVVAPIVLAQVVRLKQIAITPYLVGLVGREFARDWNSCKLETLRELVSSTDEKILITTHYSALIPYIEASLRAIKVTSIWVAGKKKISEAEFDRRIKKFQNDPTVQCLVGMVDCIGEGHTLTAASMIIRMDRHWNPNRNTQVRGRIERIGQTKPMTIYNILVRNSVEEWLDNMLDQKQTVIDQVNLRLKERYHASLRSGGRV